MCRSISRMASPASQSSGARMNRSALISVQGLDRLIQALRRDGHEVIGPVRRDGAIVYDRIGSVADLPAGWTDEHGPGHYRLRRREDAALFGYVVGPHSWKNHLHPPRRRLVAGAPARRTGRDRSAGAGNAEARVHRRAQLRPARDRHPGPRLHRARTPRRGVSATPGSGFRRRGQLHRSAPDLLLRVDANRTPRERRIRPRAHRAARRRSPRLSRRDRYRARRAPARGERFARAGRSGRRGSRAADALHARAVAQMGRRLDTTGLKELLQANPEHPRWDEVASAAWPARTARWSARPASAPPSRTSAISTASTPSAGGAGTRASPRTSPTCTAAPCVRRSGPLPPVAHPQARHLDRPVRRAGCVGCGRCITWCPVGIDITEEATALREGVAPGSIDDMKTLEDLLGSIPSPRAWTTRSCALIAGCATQRRLRSRASYLFREGERRGPLLPAPPRHASRSRCPCPARRADLPRRVKRGRDRSACRGCSRRTAGSLRRAGGRARRARSPSTRTCLRDKCEADHDLGYD